MKKVMLFVLLLILALFSFSCGKDAPSETVLLCGDEAIVCYGEKGFVIYGGSLKSSLTLENSHFDSLEIDIYSENGKIASLSAEKGETQRVRRVGGSLSAVIISANGEEYAYALTLSGFEALLSSDCPRITVIDNINIKGDLTITRPLSLYARSFLNVEGAVYYLSDEEGKLDISGNISAEKFACSAEKSDVFIPENLVGGNTELYINAKSLNGFKRTEGERVVYSLEELSELALMPPYFDSAKETVVISNVVFDAPFVIDFPCKLKIEDSCKETENLRIETDEKGEIQLLGDFNYRKININAPNCNIKWDNSCRLDMAEKSFVAKSLNGYELKSYALGGDGKNQIISATMKGEGALSTCDIIWTSHKNILSATVSGVVAPSALKNAELVFETDGGQVSIDEASKGERGGIDLTEKMGAYVTVTDNKGKERKYLIKTTIETKLPVVTIETEYRAPIEDRENYVKAKFAIESDFAKGFSSMDETSIQIKGRGNSTWNWFEKKPYKIKFENDVSLLGLREGKEWVLLANYADNSLIRNYVGLESAKVLDNMDCYASQYPVDVFINGEYAGVYSIGEQIEVAPSRVELEVNAKSVDTGFFFEIGGTYEEDGENSFSTRYMKYVDVLSPKGASFTEKHKTYIENYFALADETVRKASGYEDFIDVDALIDWLILTELSFNSDGAMRRSVYMKKDHGGKIEMGPMWDFDIAYGNSETDYENYSAWCCLATEYDYVSENWICALMEDEEFVDTFRTRWNEVKDKLYSLSMDAVDNASQLVAPSAKYNFEKWRTLGEKVTLQPDFMAQYDTYEKHIEYLKSFIENRFNWIDQQLNGEITD